MVSFNIKQLKIQQKKVRVRKNKIMKKESACKQVRTSALDIKFRPLDFMAVKILIKSRRLGFMAVTKNDMFERN